MCWQVKLCGRLLTHAISEHSEVNIANIIGLKC